MYAFQYHRPSSLVDAAKLITGDAKLLAGGHTLIPTMKQRLANPSALIDLAGVAELRGIQKSAPILAAVFIFVVLSSIGLPGLNGFAGEFLILTGSFITKRWFAVVAATGVILAALYLLWAFQRAFHGMPDEANANVPDLSWKEGLVMLPLMAIILFTGIYPKPLLSRMEPSVNHLIRHVEVHTHYRQPPVAVVGPAVVAAPSTQGGGK